MQLSFFLDRKGDEEMPQINIAQQEQNDRHVDLCFSLLITGLDTPHEHCKRGFEYN